MTGEREALFVLFADSLVHLTTKMMMMVMLYLSVVWEIRWAVRSLFLLGGRSSYRDSYLRLSPWCDFDVCLYVCLPAVMQSRTEEEWKWMRGEIFLPVADCKMRGFQSDIHWGGIIRSLAPDGLQEKIEWKERGKKRQQRRRSRKKRDSKKK